MRPLLAVVIALVACAKAPSIAPDPTAERHRAEQAESELRRFGKGRFEVLSFTAEPERVLRFVDDFDYPTTQHHVPFRARVRLTAPLVVLGDSDLIAQQKLPGWTPAATREGLELTFLFGPGSWEGGKELDISAAAAFDDLEPGDRFRVFDRRR
ncbi:MAG: hypothetical protein HYV09_15150 [Deltaproteobacteria bacterium]|nr:hypothetical protein [Deltaproteobacteria bacterium]